MRFIHLFACLLLVSLWHPLHAETSEQASAPIKVESFYGHWSSDDNSHLGPSRAALTIAQDLNGRTVRLEYSLSTIADETATEVLAGIAYYQLVEGKAVAGFWADSAGNLLTIKPELTEDSLIARWSRSELPEGMTVYAIEAEGSLLVTDYVQREGEWSQFNQMRFTRSASKQEIDMDRHVLGIGGLFFRGDNPSSLSKWYSERLAVSPPPQSYDELPWRQEEGYTVFAPFERNTEYFGDPARQWMVNFRVRDLDGLVAKLHEAGEEVSEPETFPNGRFARLNDPEGNPIQLWEPSE